MDVSLLQISGLLRAVPDLQSSGLVVGTVGARDELLVLLLEGEPGLQVVLLGCRVVQGAGDNGDNVVREF